MDKHLIPPSSPRTLFDRAPPPSRLDVLKRAFNDPLVKVGGAFVGCLLGATALIHVTVSETPAPQSTNAPRAVIPSP